MGAGAPQERTLRERSEDRDTEVGESINIYQALGLLHASSRTHAFLVA